MSASTDELFKFDGSASWSLIELMLIEFIKVNPELYKIKRSDQIPQEVIEECSKLLKCNAYTVKETWQSLRKNYTYYLKNKNHANFRNSKYSDGTLSFWAECINKENNEEEVIFYKTVTLADVRNLLKTKFSTDVDALDNETLISPSIQDFANKLVKDYTKNFNQTNILNQNLSKPEEKLLKSEDHPYPSIQPITNKLVVNYNIENVNVTDNPIVEDIVVKTEEGHDPSILALADKLVEDHNRKKSNLANTLRENILMAEEEVMEMEEGQNSDLETATVDDDNKISGEKDALNIYEGEGPSRCVMPKITMAQSSHEQLTCKKIQNNISKKTFLEIHNKLNNEDFFYYISNFVDEYSIEKKRNIVAKMWDIINLADQSSNVE